MVSIRSILALQLLVLFLTTISFNAVVLGVATKHPPPPPPSPSPPAIAVPPALQPIKQSPPPPPPPIGKKVLISVEGVVYCRYCKFPGYDKALRACPLQGALAKLVCYNKRRKRGVVVTTKTNSSGYFLIQSDKLSGFQARNCKVVVTSPLKVCSKLVYSGMPLKFERVTNVDKTLVALYTAGFFEFAPRNGN